MRNLKDISTADLWAMRQRIEQKAMGYADEARRTLYDGLIPNDSLRSIVYIYKGQMRALEAELDRRINELFN